MRSLIPLARLFAVAALLMGAVHSLQHGSTVGRLFDGLDYLPLIEAVAFVGEYGLAFAAAFGLLAGVTLLAEETSVSQSMLLASACTMVGYIVATPLLFLGALVAWVGWWKQRAPLFTSAAARSLQSSDVPRVFLFCLAAALINVAVLLVGRRIWTARERSLGKKRAIAIAMLVGLNVAVAVTGFLRRDDVDPDAELMRNLREFQADAGACAGD